MRITDPEKHAKWLKWGQWRARCLDPLQGAGPNPWPQEELPRENIPIADIPLTRDLRDALERMGVRDADGLAKVDKAAIGAELPNVWRAWEEVKLVLEGLGY